MFIVFAKVNTVMLAFERINGVPALILPAIILLSDAEICRDRYFSQWIHWPNLKVQRGPPEVEAWVRRWARKRGLEGDWGDGAVKLGAIGVLTGYSCCKA